MKIQILLLSLFFCTAANAASLLPVCSEAKSLKNCSKSQITFPTYAKNGSGQATFRYKYDLGGLGDFSEAELVELSDETLDLWSAVSNIQFEKVDTGFIDVDITADNISDYLDEEQGFNLIVWDEDGSALNSLFGKGAKQGILGFASSFLYTQTNAGKIKNIAESQTLLNGFLFQKSVLNVSQSRLEGIFQTTVLHEFAHMFGIDHTQGGNLEGFKNDEGDLTDVPIMFPIDANPEVALHQDDIAAIKLAYPISSEANSFGQITGNLSKGDKDLTGANVVAYKIDEANPKLKAVASPSDVDGQKKANFIIPNLLPGNYVLYAEPISSEFVDGSSIGIHQTPANFNAGFYNGAESFLNLSFSNGINRAEVITVSAGDNLNIDINVDSSSTGSNGTNNGDSFELGGKVINESPIILKGLKTKKANLKLVNLNKGTKLNLRLSSEFPDLISFSKDQLGFKKRSKKVKVKFAPFIEFVQVQEFAALLNGDTASTNITVEDLDTGTTKIEEIIIQ